MTKKERGTALGEGQISAMSASKKEFKCQRCGKCCKEFVWSLFLTKEEVKKWRKNIVKSNYGKFQAISFAIVTPAGTADLFFHPIYKKELSRCPFLRKLPTKERYKCLIHDIKPELCRDFPFDESGKVRSDSTAGICPEVQRLKNLSEA